MQGSSNSIPNLNVIIWATIAAIGGYLGFSIAIFLTGDAGMKGDVIGTWKSFAVLAFGFWLGSSSAGKAVGNGIAQRVKIANTKKDPVPVKDNSDNASTT